MILPPKGFRPVLILSRQRDESIIINSDIFITVVEIRGDKVRLGIEAPVETPVHRLEVYDAIRRENIEFGRDPDYMPPRLRARLRNRLDRPEGGAA